MARRDMKAAIIRYTEEHYGPADAGAWSWLGRRQAGDHVALQAILNPQEEVIFPRPTG